MFSFLKSLEHKLSGWPNDALTILLVVYGIAFILIGLFGYRTLKLATAVYALL